MGVRILHLASCATHSLPSHFALQNNLSAIIKCALPTLPLAVSCHEPPAAVPPPIVVPSILHNREPYRHGDWRKTPYAPRPYERLQKYHIVEEVTRQAIENKLSTHKGGGCAGDHCNTREALGTYSLEAEGFDTACSCLARNTECDAACGCDGTGQCLNRAITRREALVLGQDLAEINSWGMDCYTRKNIQDGELLVMFGCLFSCCLCTGLRGSRCSGIDVFTQTTENTVLC